MAGQGALGGPGRRARSSSVLLGSAGLLLSASQLLEQRRDVSWCRFSLDACCCCVGKLRGRQEGKQEGACLGLECWSLGSGLNADRIPKQQRAGVPGGAVAGYEREELGHL